MAESIARRMRKTGRAGWIFGFGFFLFFFAFGSVFVWLFFLGPALNVRQARNWSAVPCTVVSSDVKSHSDSDGTTYSIEITYRYEVGGASYTGKSYSFQEGSSSGYDGKRRVVAAHPPGHETVCYVDPEDPTRSVLNPGMTGDIWMGLFTLIFPAVGLAGMIGLGVAAARKRGRLGGGGRARGKGARLGPHGFAPVDRSAAAAAEVPNYLPRYDPQQRPRVLRPRFGRLGKLAFFLVFALLWNGVVSVFIVTVVKSFLDRDPEWFLALFMIPFAAIGLGTIGAVVFQVLKLFNPVPVLTLDEPATPLGGTLRFEWRVRGAVRRIHTFTISLIAQEEATYRVGTSSYTDRAKFFEAVLVETSDTDEMRRGSATIAIPADAMHSLDLAHNNIRWYFRITGDIHRWPDLADDLDLIILPAEART